MLGLNEEETQVAVNPATNNGRVNTWEEVICNTITNAVSGAWVKADRNATMPSSPYCWTFAMEKKLCIQLPIPLPIARLVAKYPPGTPELVENSAPSILYR